MTSTTNGTYDSKWDIHELESLLSNHLSPGTKLLKYELKNLTAPGENYGSVMQALDVTIQEPNQKSVKLHLVAKRIPANEMLFELFNVQETFKIETNMYFKVIPALANFEKESGVEEKIKDLFAKCFGARINLNQSEVVDEDAAILLENLKVLGYEVGDRLTGFDEPHVIRILEDLANFHAVPIAFRIKNPKQFENIILPFIKGVKIADKFDENAKQMAINEVLDTISDNKKCQPYLKTISDAISANLDGQSRIDQKVTIFSTVSHTDYWVNNTMILKDNNGHPIKNKIVDLQMPAYCSSVRDLLFFLFSSVQPEILYKNIDKYLKFYYDCFIKCLKQFDIDLVPFCWENFINEIKNNAFVEIGHILIMYKPILTIRGAIDDMANLNVDNIFKPKVSDDYPSRVTGCILTFIDREWL